MTTFRYVLQDEDASVAGDRLAIIRTTCPVSTGDGARRPRLCEDLSTWLAEVLAAPPFRALKHPGNHTYVWPLDGRRDTAATLAPQAGSYPKIVDTNPNNLTLETR